MFSNSFNKIKKNKNPNFLKVFFSKLLQQANIYLMKLTYFNKHTYFFVNYYLIKLEEKTSKIIQNREKMLCLTFFFPFTLISLLSTVEIIYYNKIWVSFYLFLLVLLFQRVIIFLFFLLEIIARNSVDFNFKQIYFSLNFEFEPKDDKDFIFVFLNSENLNKFIYNDEIFEKDYLLNKFLITFSMLHFSGNWVLLKIYLNYFFNNCRIICSCFLFLVILSVYLLKNISIIFLFDVFLYLSFFYFILYSKIKETQD